MADLKLHRSGSRLVIYLQGCIQFLFTTIDTLGGLKLEYFHVAWISSSRCKKHETRRLKVKALCLLEEMFDSRGEKGLVVIHPLTDLLEFFQVLYPETWTLQDEQKPLYLAVRTQHSSVTPVTWRFQSGRSFTIPTESQYLLMKTARSSDFYTLETHEEW